MSYVYQLAVRKASPEKEKFIVEHDIIVSEKEFLQSDVDAMSLKYECDVKLSFIGMLDKPEDHMEFSADYYTDDMIQEYIKEWSQTNESNHINVI